MSWLQNKALKFEQQRDPELAESMQGQSYLLAGSMARTASSSLSSTSRHALR